jgi:methanogenic corrinoid protein MtbC1
MTVQIEETNALAAISIDAALEPLAAEAVRRAWRRWPDLRTSLTTKQATHLAEDIRHHVRFISAAVRFDEPAILDDYLAWCSALFESLALPSEWLVGSFECISEALGEKLAPEEALIARALVSASLATLAAPTARISPSALPPEPLGALARAYLDAALAGQQHRAVAVLREAVRAGLDVRRVYSDVFQPVQREVGHLWLTNRISIAEEHYVTAVTQLSMALLYDEVFVEGPFDRTVVVACAGRELHELGARMVADFFELDGWNSHYLGANTPAEAIVRALKATSADLLALSATMAVHLVEVAEVIALMRQDEATRDIPVLVGGYPFALAPGLWRGVGADGTADDAAGAVERAVELVGHTRARR